MTAPRAAAVRVLVAILIAATGSLWVAVPARGGLTAAPADPCQDRGVEVDLAGSGDVGVVSGRSVACSTGTRPRSRAAPSPADEVLCPPGGAAGTTGGLCSASPCAGPGLHFVLRTVRGSGGGQGTTASACMTLRSARVGPAVSAADVLRAVRAVRLPGGSIRARPGGRGLANLAAYFRLDGVSARTVDLPLRGSIIHAEFRVVAYRWAFGDGSAAASVATGLPGSGGSAHAYQRGGRFDVRVEVAWSAQAFLDGRRVGRVDGLVSSARVTYPVAELRASLSG
jgi:hypothetical protein